MLGMNYLETAVCRCPFSSLCFDCLTAESRQARLSKNKKQDGLSSPFSFYDRLLLSTIYPRFKGPVKTKADYMTAPGIKRTG